MPFITSTSLLPPAQGGALLGTKRTMPDKDFAAVAEQLAKFNIQVKIGELSFSEKCTGVEDVSLQPKYPPERLSACLPL